MITVKSEIIGDSTVRGVFYWELSCGHRTDRRAKQKLGMQVMCPVCTEHATNKAGMKKLDLELRVTSNKARVNLLESEIRSLNYATMQMEKELSELKT